MRQGRAGGCTFTGIEMVRDPVHHLRRVGVLHEANCCPRTMSGCAQTEETPLNCYLRYCAASCRYHRMHEKEKDHQYEEYNVRPSTAIRLAHRPSVTDNTRPAYTSSPPSTSCRNSQTACASAYPPDPWATRRRRGRVWRAPCPEPGARCPHPHGRCGSLGSRSSGARPPLARPRGPFAAPTSCPRLRCWQRLRIAPVRIQNNES